MSTTKQMISIADFVKHYENLSSRDIGILDAATRYTEENKNKKEAFRILLS